MNSTDAVVCHKCKKTMLEGEGYYVSLLRLHWTAQNLPVSGHLYCEECIEKVHEMAFSRGLGASVKRLTSGPGAVETAEDVRARIIKNGWNKEEWKQHCLANVSWWWERHRLVAQARMPPWEDSESDLDTVAGKYRRQAEAWQRCDQISDRADSMPQLELVKKVDDLIRAYPEFEAYARFWRGVRLDRLGAPSAAIEDFNRALDLDSELHWAYYYRAVCFYKTGNVAQATRDKDRAFKLMPNLKRGYAGCG